MTAEEGDEEKKTTAMWTTWEELLLACAVKRHGLNDWDTVAVEIQTRTTPSLADSFTPKICCSKYHELKRRFSDETPAAGDDGGDVNVPWIEELRKLRVAELTKDVQRYDRSIQSLQLKVKRLEEERENSLKESGDKNDDRADLDRSENDKIDADGVPDFDSPANTDGKEVSGEHSSRSFNESNSSEDRDKTGGKRDSESEPVQTITGGGSNLKTDPESKTMREDSCNDSSDTVAKYLAAKTSHVQKKNSNESRDSEEEASESKEGTKESSDVQSSANLTKKKRKPGKVSGDGGGGAKAEPVEVFSATTSTAAMVVKSEPLVAVMDIIRAHKHGSMFERRLESQKSDKYNKIVRQHVDLRVVQTRIEDGSYSSCTNKFFLDLLLIFNNAIIYFPKQSTESIAAQQLRLLVSKEMRKKPADRKSQPDPSSKPDPDPIVTKPDPERPDSLLTKQKSAVPIVVCRKRSSISGKKEKEPVAAAAKPLVIPKPLPVVKTSSNEDEEDTMKMKMKEKPVTGVRSMRRSGNSSRSNNVSNVAPPSKNQVTSSSTNLGNSTSKGSDGGGGGGGSGPTKVEKKKVAEVTPAVKKRGAADFLKRLKKNSPAKGTAAVVEEDGGGGSRKDQVKKKVEEGRDGAAGRQKGGGGGGGRKAVKEDVSPSKKGIGRPAKKGKEVVAPAKRGREIVEPESASKRPTKRSKR